MKSHKLVVIATTALWLLSCANAETIVLSGEFTMTDENKMPNAKLTGTFHYKYDTNTPTNSRLRFSYNVNYGLLNNKHYETVSELYDYNDQAIFSMCPGSCTATRNTAEPDMWWKQWTDQKVYNKEGGEHTWYERPGANSAKPLKYINVGSTNKPSRSPFKLSAIEYYDGRQFVFKDGEVKYQRYVTDSSVFETDAGVKCPSAKCKSYMNLVFVIDDTGSVIRPEWNQQVTFVTNVINGIEVSQDSAYVSLISFRAPSKSYGTVCSEEYRKYAPDGEDPDEYWGRKPGVPDRDFLEWRVHDDCPWEKYASSTEDFYHIFYDLTWDYEKVKKKIRRPTSGGNTCMGKGLEQAKVQFDNVRRNQKAQNVVILVTDGEDFCPNASKDAIDVLKSEKYQATVFIVGVGLQTTYDENFLRGLASTINGQPAYYSVDNYEAISVVIDQMITPICEDLGTSGCNPDCRGFCGCGQCYCPECQDTEDNDKCQAMQCYTDSEGITSAGCVKNVKSCGTSDACTVQECNAQTGECEKKQVENPYKGTMKYCQSAECDTESGWKLTNNDNLCVNQNNLCEVWECVGEDGDEKGCKLVGNKEEECTKLQTSWCLVPYCKEADGQCHFTDTCAEETKNNKCWKSECQDNKCTNTSTPFDAETDDCTLERLCDPTTGWYTEQADDEWCKEDYKKQHPDEKLDCLVFQCKPQGGCTHERMENCSEVCDQDDIEECAKKAVHDESVCRSATCYYDTDRKKYCNVINTTCTSTKKCQRAYCNKETGQCAVEDIVDPYTSDRCHVSECDQATNSWVLVETDEAKACVSDGCFGRHCDPVQGCVAVSKCNSTKCYTEECNNETKQCQRTEIPSPYVNNSCQYSYCEPEKEGWVLVVLTDDQACPTEDKCVIATCNRTSGQCEYKNKTIDWNDPEALATYDLCSNYTCNSTTGEFDLVGPKCVSELFCTKTKCDYKGECYQVEEECEDLDMTGYDCFYRSCTESRQCYRKLYTNAYIDICGRCLRDYDPLNPNQSLTQSEEEDCVDEMATPVLSTALTAAAIAGIVIAAIVGAAALAASGVFGTKELIKRAANAADQSAHSNPLFESNAQEMSNPAYMGDAQ